MEPWIQPTTAPHQPDLATEEPFEPRIERGWMESPRIPDRPDSLGIKVLVASVAIGFPLLMVVILPLMLRWLAS
jgi:hypothetical protein